jgi:hypothetical protein
LLPAQGIDQDCLAFGDEIIANMFEVGALDSCFINAISSNLGTLQCRRRDGNLVAGTTFGNRAYGVPIHQLAAGVHLLVNTTWILAKKRFVI